MSILWNGFLQGLSGVWTIARVVIPLMIVLEIAQANNILQRINHVISKPFRWIGLGEEGAFPLVVAMVFGLTFGSGVIIAHMREGKVSDQEGRIIGTFMALCHALIEDTIIFMTLGAPFLFLIIPRVAVAFIACMVVYGVQRKKAVGRTVLLMALIMVLGFGMWGQAHAMGVNGDVWYIMSSADRFGTDAQVSYGGSVSILDLGSLQAGLRCQLIGNPNDWGTLWKLYTNQLEKGNWDPADRLFIQNRSTAFVGGELSVWDNLKLLGNVGYGDTAYAGKEAGSAELDYALYRGMSVQLGLVRTISLGFDLFGTVEYAPAMTSIRQSGSVNHASHASWSALDMGARFRLPFITVRGGIRWQGLEESGSIQEYVGFFLGGGIRF
ncbi:MAG: hypothetical protein GX331_00045 [Firmicutes bacterium]|nr:hypothetical protein [Bacillota bacterium]